MKYIVISKKKWNSFLYTAFIIAIFTLISFVSLDYSYLFASGDEMIEGLPYEKELDDTTLSKLHNLTKTEEKIAYLTFDDGPTPKVTPKVLDILDQMDVKANFFVVGKHVEELPQLVKREYDSGHYIANHGYSHNNKKLYRSKNSFLLEVIKTDQVISNAIGVANYRSHIFRFPNGSMSKTYYTAKQNSIRYLDEIDYTYLDWNALNNDSIKKYSKEGLLTNLKNSVRNKGSLVILMHDTGDVNNTYDILEDSILYLKNQGYEFRTFYDVLEGSR